MTSKALPLGRVARNRRNSGSAILLRKVCGQLAGRTRGAKPLPGTPLATAAKAAPFAMARAGGRFLGDHQRCGGLGGLRHGGSGKGGKSGLYRAASVPEQGNFLSSHILWARQRRTDQHDRRAAYCQDGFSI
jgi:hypothetical protein